MKSLLLSVILFFSGIFIVNDFVFAQTFNTGNIGVELNNFGRIRVHAPAIGTRQIDRASILVGVSSSAVFDYTQDAGTATAASTVSSPTLSDFEVTGAVNNSFSNLPPNVLVTSNIYGWTNGGYAVVKFTIQNNEAAAINAVIGLEVIPQIDAAYGNEVVNYLSANNVVSISKNKHVGFKIFSSPLTTLTAFNWSTGYGNDASYYQWLTTNTIQPSFNAGTDGAVVIMSQSPVTINPQATATVFYGIAVGDNQTQMLANMNSAELKYNIVVPVELISFNGIYANGRVMLNWSTATELNNLGFEIERKIENSDWSRIAFVKGAGTTTDPVNYIYNDVVSDLQPGTLLYRLKQLDFDGTFTYTDAIEVDVYPSDYTILQNYPNPFNPSTTIKYNVVESGYISLKIYDIIGNLVAVLIDEEKRAGSYSINFDAAGLSSGVYYYTLKYTGGLITNKMMLIK